MKPFFTSGGPRVKICGITNPDDAKATCDAGADALGFNLFTGSRRHVSLNALEPWINELPADVARVAVVVNASADDLRVIHEKGIFDAIQFHGDETPDFCNHEGGPLWIRAIRVDTAAAFERALEYKSKYVLFDGFTQGDYGGTGVSPDWHTIAGFAMAHPKHFTILAGGLTPDNVAEAVQIVSPQAVDVASGVEKSPGIKDPAKVARFIREAKGI
ncbi:MAG: phosphoribosylanthranilate isomerase [Chthoniobacterales bacterium]